jgi:hypothetical protein
MVEYGTTISHGGAGQVSGGAGGGTSPIGGHASGPDVGAQLTSFVNDATHTFSTMPFIEQVLVVVVGLFILYLVARRAF